MNYNEVKSILFGQLRLLEKESAANPALRHSSLPELTTAMCMIIPALNSLPDPYLKSYGQCDPELTTPET